MLDLAPGQPMSKDKHDLRPSPGSFPRDKRWRKPPAPPTTGRPPVDQRDTLDDTTLSEGLRKLGILVSRQDQAGLRRAADELYASIWHTSKRPADMHLHDAGLNQFLVKEFDQHDIHTIRDLAYCAPLVLCRTMNVLDVLKGALICLRVAIEVE